jgi:hypothetical protein
VSVYWLQPLAWWGLGLLALPILIHLLARHRSRRLHFPSLKFLPVEPMAALRRRVLTNWPLLVVRLLILAAAVAAFAAPVLVSEARRQAWDRRVARAIVVVSPQTDEIRAIAAEEAQGSYASAEFSGGTVPDSLRDARRWLDAQAPAAREIVVIGDLREGALTKHDLTAVPTHVGLRFLPVVNRDEPRAIEWRTVADSPEGTPGARRVVVTPNASQTQVRYETVSDDVPASVRVVAAPADQSYADAVLRAVWRDGIVLGSSADRAVTIAFEGAALPGLIQRDTPSQPWMRATLEHLPNVRGGGLNDVLVVTPNVSVRDARAPRIVAEVLRAAFVESRVALEPRRVSVEAVAAWSRPHGPSPPDVPPANEGDHRWFWGAALLLMALEHAIRRRARAA